MSLAVNWPEWCTPQQLAARWQVSVSTIHRMHRTLPDFGRMMGTGGALRIHRDHVEAVEKMELQEKTTKALRRNRQQLAGSTRKMDW